MPDLSASRPNALLQHLDSLYTFAQILTPDAEQAADLVVETYRRAMERSPSERLLTDEKAWLFQLMRELYRERAGGGETSEAEAAAPGDSALREVRLRLCRGLVDRALPAVFATLPHEHRLLLTLCDVENLSCVEASVVVGLDAVTACARLEEARRTLSRILRNPVSSAERRLLYLLPEEPSEWMPAALQRMIAAELSPLPPTLPSAVAAALEPDRTAAPTHDAAPVARGGSGPLRSRRRPLRGLLTGLAIIVFTGLIGYGVTALIPEPETDFNIITLSARRADDVRPTFRTTSPEQAERYVRDRLGRRITIPSIDHVLFVGVGSGAIIPGAEVPVLLFEDPATGERITVFTYSYAFLERNRGRVQLERDILLQIESDDRFDLHDLGERKVLVWRNRDDIFVAVTAGDADLLRSRIHFPS
ncbi:RNA polymerase sigma factor [Rhodocaloribacter sp.]